MSEQSETQDSISSKINKVVAPILSIIGLISSGIAKEREIRNLHLDGWDVLLWLSIFGVLWVGFYFCRQWVKNRIANVAQKIAWETDNRAEGDRLDRERLTKIENQLRDLEHSPPKKTS